MSFLIKNPSVTPGFALYSPNQANVDAGTINLNFVGGTFQALEGNGTSVLTLQGGFRYSICLDWSAKNVSSGASTMTPAVTKYYMNVSMGAPAIYTRAYSAGQDQSWRSTIVFDATSDSTYTIGGKSPGTSLQVSIWRFPL
jgi:hypothetical protein